MLIKQVFVKDQRRSTDLIVALANGLIQEKHKGLSESWISFCCFSNNPIKIPPLSGRAVV